jgi:ADP-L-glycero-D-manno-heptose 6-epimerase
VSPAQTDLNGKTVLITGGAGFIGSNLALHIEQHFHKCRVIVADAFALGHFQNLRGFRGECLAADITSEQDLKQLAGLRFDVLFHQAAISDTTVADQGQMLRVNANAFRRLLEIAASLSATVVYASSAGVYGNSPAPNRIGDGEVPENVYGFSKLMMDHAASEFLRARPQQRIVGLRYFNVFGPGESFKGRMASMILQLGKQLLAGERPKLFKHGEQRRDFVYIEDVVQANLRALKARQSGVYNVGSGRARSFNEVLEILGNVLRVRSTAEFIDNPWTFFQTHTEADIAATQAQLDYQPRFSLEAGIERYAPEIRRLAAREAA